MVKNLNFAIATCMNKVRNGSFTYCLHSSLCMYNVKLQCIEISMTLTLGLQYLSKIFECQPATCGGRGVLNPRGDCRNRAPSARVLGDAI